MVVLPGSVNAYFSSLINSSYLYFISCYFTTGGGGSGGGGQYTQFKSDGADALVIRDLKNELTALRSELYKEKMKNKNKTSNSNSNGNKDAQNYSALHLELRHLQQREQTQKNEITSMKATTKHLCKELATLRSNVKEGKCQFIL